MWMFCNTFVPVKAILLSFAVNLQSFFSHQRVLAFNVLKRTRSNVFCGLCERVMEHIQTIRTEEKELCGFVGNIRMATLKDK